MGMESCIQWVILRGESRIDYYADLGTMLVSPIHVSWAQTNFTANIFRALETTLRIRAINIFHQNQGCALLLDNLLPNLAWHECVLLFVGYTMWPPKTTIPSHVQKCFSEPIIK